MLRYHALLSCYRYKINGIKNKTKICGVEKKISKM